MKEIAILQPVIALGLWTGVMMIWMYATRIPAMNASGVDPQNGQHPHQLASALPSEVARVADNYNHLFEQPTLFYVVALAIAIMGSGDTLAVQLAWGFVGIRVIHSIVQSTVNIVLLRFGIFMLSWLVLLVLIVREALRIF